LLTMYGLRGDQCIEGFVSRTRKKKNARNHSQPGISFFPPVVLSAYLDNSATLSTFSVEISWAVFLIMVSLICDMFVGVLSANMSGFAAYEP